MNNKYSKYIYFFTIFYTIWLIILPLGVRLCANPVLTYIYEQTGINIQVSKPRVITSVIPHLKVKANYIQLLNKDGSKALELKNPNLNIRILPLFIGRIHVNSFESKYIFSDLKFNDKLYLGDYPIEIKDQNIQPTIDRIKIKKYEINLTEKNKRYALNGDDTYFKTGKKTFVFHTLMNCIADNYISSAKFDINFPKNKNLSKTKFDISLNNFNLAPFSDVVSRFVYKDISSIDGVIDFNSNSKNLSSTLTGIKVIFKDKYKSMIFPDKLYLTSDYRIGKESVSIDRCRVFAKGLSANLSGEILNIFSKTPYLDLKTNIGKSDLRVGALLLPPIITSDINIPKLKEYPFYGLISGDIKIKGELPEPEIFGGVKVTDGIMIHPIPDTKQGANININFERKKLLLDVVVPAGGREIVYVTGDILIYGDKYANLKVKSSSSVNLNVAEQVLNPLHEILCFLIGPVPIMDIEGRGNVDIKIVGTKLDPHIWGDFNFVHTDARFLDVHNLTLKNAEGNLNFNNQNAHFINRTGTLHGQPITIDGVCTLFGDLDFNVTANKQNLNDLIITLTTSPMLKDMKSLVPPLSDVKGKTDFYLNLKGKILDINDLQMNKNIFPKGYIKLLGNDMKLHGLSLKNVKGIIDYDRANCKFNLESYISSVSKAICKGSIKDGIADILIDAPKILVNEFEPEKLRYLDELYIKLHAKYKGKIDNIQINGIDSNIEVIKNSKPVKNGKILSGKITLKHSNLNISNVRGVIKQNPFYLNLSVKNLGTKKLNLLRARFNGNFNCKDFDLSTVNYIKKANILPYNLQKELNKIHVVYGNATVNAKIRNNHLNSVLDMDTVNFDYSVYEDSHKEIVTVPIKLINGQIVVKNDKLYLHKLNCLIDNMPLLLFGQVDNIYRNPKYNIHINSKLVQRVFDKYWNAHNIYPIKMNGDILYSSLISGDKNNTHIKSDIRIEENSSIYYMGAIVGDSLNPITVNLDAEMNKDGRIKLHKFKYNKLIASQNNRQNVLPLLAINGEIKKMGKIYTFKDLIIKTENPANANFFNIIFKKPTIKQGNFVSDLKINGTSNRPKIIGKFDVSNMEMPYLNTTIKDLALDFKPDVINVTTKGEVLSNYIMVNANVKNNLIPPYKVTGADIYINDFDVNHSISQLKQMELNGLSSAISPDADANADLLNTLVFDNVKIRAGNVRIKNIKASNLEAVCSLNDRMQMAVESFKFNMASGTITGKVGYNILNNFMKMELNAKAVNANALTIALFDLPNQIYGSLTGHIELSCNATNDKTKMETLNGYGNFRVINGRMPKLGSLEYLLKAGNLIKGGITGISMNSIIDIITPMKTGEFSSINGNLRIKDGIAKTIEIHSHGKDLSLYITGRLNFNTQVADMRVFGQISRKISTVLGAAGNISLNTLFNKIPGVRLDSDSSFINDLNKIPGIELSDKASRKFMVEILGDINGEDFVKSFRWIN